MSEDRCLGGVELVHRLLTLFMDGVGIERRTKRRLRREEVRAVREYLSVGR